MSDAPPDAEFRHGIVVVSHDASRSGAPLIALNIARELVEARGIPVVIILLGSGELEPEFARLGPLFVLSGRPAFSYHRDPRGWKHLVKRAMRITDDGEPWRRVSKYLADRYIRHAICNSVVSGHAAARLKKAGVACLGLVHELPYTIRAFGLADQATALVQASDALVFPCSQVKAAFRGAFPIGEKPNFVFPQGPGANLAENRTSIRSSFRTQLGLTSDDILILGCGAGEFRKGIDLFVHAAREMAWSSTPLPTGKIVFAWAGQIDRGFRVWAEKDRIELNLSERLLFLGSQQDVTPCFAAADIFFLPSREDPFPNVVLEAMASGLPVVGFAGSGGVEEQVRGGIGLCVPYGDVASAVEALRRLAERPDERARMGTLGRERITLSGGYHKYVGKLIHALAATAMPSDITEIASPQDSHSE